MTDNASKPNRFSRWFRETVGELRKVSWPTPQETWNLTKIVLLVMLVMAAILGFLDFIFSTLITMLVA
jgi:preprotein translocase subunit SecE